MIYTIGETVIDLIFKNMQPQAAKVGGSALNTSVSLGRLGNQVSFISEIGADEFGAWCTQFLAENGVDTAHLVQYSDKKTSLAIAFLNEQNDAHYQFYKEFTEPMPSASVNFNSSDILLLLLQAPTIISITAVTIIPIPAPFKYAFKFCKHFSYIFH